MPNVVTDSLPTWQPDADAADSNHPIIGEALDQSSPTELSAELRSIKSNVRAFSLDPAWVNFAGCTDTRYCPSPAVALRVNANQFTLVGDWTVVGGFGQPAIAQVGRQVRITTQGGTRFVATVTAVVPGGTTLVTITGNGLVNAGDLIATLEWGLLNPAESASVLTPVLSGSDFVLPATQGGTQQTGAGGDIGAFPNPKVTGLQGKPLSATVPATFDLLTYDGTQWGGQQPSSLLNLAQTIGVPGAFRVPTENAPGGIILVQWCIVGPVTVPANSVVAPSFGPWPALFATGAPYVVLATASEPKITATVDPTQDIVSGVVVSLFNPFGSDINTVRACVLAIGRSA